MSIGRFIYRGKFIYRGNVGCFICCSIDCIHHGVIRQLRNVHVWHDVMFQMYTNPMFHWQATDERQARHTHAHVFHAGAYICQVRIYPSRE